MNESNKAQTIRVKFIDAVFSTRGTANRSDVESLFSVSYASAGRDFRHYMDIGGQVQFVPQRHQYERDYHFRSLYFKSAEEASEFIDSVRQVYGAKK